MKNLKDMFESIFDVDDNIENVKRSKLIGDELEVRIETLECFAWDVIFNKKIINYKPKIHIHKSPKITTFDNETNKVLESLITIILNCPLEWVENEKILSKTPEMLYDIFKSFATKYYSNTGIAKMWGKPYFHADGDILTSKIINGVQRVKYPRVSFELKYK